MITYEEQKKIIEELKQRPDVKKLTKTATVLFVLGGLLAIFGIGVYLLIIGNGVLRKRDSRIDQIIAMETAKGQETIGTNVPVSVVVAKEVVEAEKKRERVEELVRVSKRIDVLLILLLSAILLTWVFALLFPIAKFSLLGIDILKISVLDLLKDEGGLYSAYAENSTIGDFSKFMYLCAGIIMLLFTLIYVVVYLLQHKEKKIRRANGEVVLKRNKRKNSAKTHAFGAVVVVLLYLFLIFLFPISWLKYAKDAVSVNTFGLIAIGAMGLISILMSIIVAVYCIKERKDVDVVLAI